MTMEGEANCHSEARRSCAVGISWVSDYVKWDSSPRRGLRMTVVGILAVAALPQNDNGGGGELSFRGAAKLRRGNLMGE